MVAAGVESVTLPAMVAVSTSPANAAKRQHKRNYKDVNDNLVAYNLPKALSDCPVARLFQHRNRRRRVDTALDNPAVAKRNLLYGPRHVGRTQGSIKVRPGERVRADLGADFNNLFNHPLFSPDQGGGDTMSQLGNFSIHVDPATRRVLPITDITPNPDFVKRC